MNAGALTKILFESWRTTVLFALALFTFEAIASAVLPSFYDELAGQLFEHAFIKNIVRALLGTEIETQLSRDAMYAMAWVHPIVLTLLWAHVIIFSTRMPVAEVDRGTADVWFALPITRRQHYLCESVACVGTLVLLLLLALAGHILGSGDDRPALVDLLRVVCNLFALCWTVTGLGYLVSTLSNRRGVAVGTVFATVLLSFFLSFLVQFWPPAEAFAGVGLLHYYRPLQVINSDGWPLFDMAVLFATGSVFWLIGGWVFARRDLLTT